MARKKNQTNTTTWLVLGLVIALVAMAGAVFKVSESPTGKVTGTGDEPSIQCSKDYEKTISFVDKDEFEKATDAGNATYKVWKVVSDDGEEMKIPQDDSSGELTIGYNEEFEVVGMIQDDNESHVRKVFEVDKNCEGPKDQIFYFAEVPDEVDSIFDHNKVTGPIADDNRLDITQDTVETVKATFTGETDTKMDAILVIDVNEDIMEDVDSNKESVDTPEAHSNGANEKSYAFDMDDFESSTDVLQNIDLYVDEDATLGAYNVSYTIYQKQIGYIDSETGNWVDEPSIEDNDDELLLPSYTGTIYVNVTA